jgi:hypothetical protein
MHSSCRCGARAERTGSARAVGEHPPRALSDGLALSVALAFEFGFVFGLCKAMVVPSQPTARLSMERKDLDRREARRDPALALSVFDRGEPPITLARSSSGWTDTC